MNAGRSPWVLGARSETGFVRSANEDRMGWARADWGDVYVVSDGMGGYRGGALAAELTLRVLQERLAALAPDAQSLRAQVQAAFLAANEEVRSRRDPDDPETCEMGATGVALITQGARALVAHVGDSRAYLWRRGSGLRRLTRDHTRVQSMQDAGLLSAEQAATHPDASVLDRAIGHRPTVEADVGEWLALEPGDLLLLCSDGLCGYVCDDEIAAVLQRDPDPAVATDALVECALQKGGADNVTVQLVGYRPAHGGVWRGRAGRLGVGSAVVGLAVAALAYGVHRHGLPWRGGAATPADAASRPAAAPGASGAASGAASVPTSTLTPSSAPASPRASPVASGPPAAPAPWPADVATPASAPASRPAAAPVAHRAPKAPPVAASGHPAKPAAAAHPPSKSAPGKAPARTAAPASAPASAPSASASSASAAGAASRPDGAVVPASAPGPVP